MQLFFNALIAGSLAALIAGGLALVYGVLGVFNLALGQMVLLGGYTTWWLYQVMHLPLFVSICGGTIFGALVSLVVFEIFVCPFYKRHRFLPLVTTIALSMILDGVILLVFEERPRVIVAGVKESYRVLGARLSAEHAVLIAVTVLLLVVLGYIMHSTAFGRKIRAVVQHDHAAMSLGIHAPLLHRALFVVSGVLAAAGGVYIGIDQSLSPTLGFPITIKAYAAVIAGGKGHVWGAVIAAFGIALLEQLAIGIPWMGGSYIPAGYQHTIALLVIILFLLVKPTGLFVRSSRFA